jgi:hypothetical protein
MTKAMRILGTIVAMMYLSACPTSYKAQPLPFKAPAAYPNATEVAGATVAAKAFVKAKEAKEAFGFDIRGAGMLPVQVVFDNQGEHSLKIKETQTFLEDTEGNLWPVLTDKIAYERATKYSKTKEIFQEGAYHAFLGATAGALLGAAIGIVGGSDVGVSAGKGAALGGATGATLGGAKGYTSDEARRSIIDDLQEKSLRNKAVDPQSLGFGFIFFPGEAKSAKQLRMQIVEVDTDTVHLLKFSL